MIMIIGDWEKEDTTAFDKAEAHLIDTEKKHSIYGTADILNPIKIIPTLCGLSYKEQVDIMLHLLSFCNIVYMLKGWENSNDLRLLHDYASNNGYKIIYSKKF